MADEELEGEEEQVEAPPSHDLDEADTEELNQQPRFCGVSQALLSQARASVYKWKNLRQLKVFVADRPSGVAATLDLYWDLIRAQYNHIQAICGLSFLRTMDPSSAQIIVKTRSIDGAGGTLAEAELPLGNDVQLSLWMDKGDKFDPDRPLTQGMIPFDTTFLHESCHNCGLPHTNVPNSLMNPYLNTSIIGLTAWEKEELRLRYGGPITPTDPPDPGTPIPPEALQDIVVTVTRGDKEVGKIVVPPAVQIIRVNS